MIDLISTLEAKKFVVKRSIGSYVIATVSVNRS